MTLPQDWKEFIESLNANDVEYVIVGAQALAYHGVPRATGDLDVFVRASRENARRIVAALSDFGFGDLNIPVADFVHPDNVVQLGRAPTRIDILTGLDGVAFEDVWRDRLDTALGELPVHLISRENLIRNKRATGRPQDLSDIERLES